MDFEKTVILYQDGDFYGLVTLKKAEKAKGKKIICIDSYRNTRKNYLKPYGINPIA